MKIEITSKYKLSREDKENILDLCEGNVEKFKSLIKCFHRLIEAEQNKVIVFNLNEKSFAQLGIAKAKADGCVLLLNRFLDYLCEISGKDNRVVALNTKGETHHGKSRRK